MAPGVINHCFIYAFKEKYDGLVCFLFEYTIVGFHLFEADIIQCLTILLTEER